MTKELKTFIKHYQTLSSEEQGLVIRELVLLKKKPPYSILFELNKEGMTKMAKTVTYCQKNSIPYTPERKGKDKVALVFQDLTQRNEVLIGRLTT